jgi:GTP-binding protein LepA
MAFICWRITKNHLEDLINEGFVIEKERGITIKSQSVTLDYHAKNGETYQLNFIDGQ